MLVPRGRVRPFVILFPGRSGGTFLATALDQHPNLRVKTEPMGMLAADGAPAQIAWTQRWFRAPLIGRHRAVGLSTKVADLCDAEAFAAFLRDRDAQAIALDRGNAVKLTVSVIRARELRQTTGRWNRFSPEAEMGAVVIDPAEFRKRLVDTMQRRAETDEFVTTLGLPALHINYEDLLTTPDETFGRVCEFLHVAPIPVQTFKNTSDDLRAAVTNFDELRAEYIGTSFEPMFDEVLSPADSPSGPAQPDR